MSSFNSVLLPFMLDVCHCLIICHLWVLLGLEDRRLSIYCAYQSVYLLFFFLNS